MSCSICPLRTISPGTLSNFRRLRQWHPRCFPGCAKQEQMKQAAGKIAYRQENVAAAAEQIY